MVEYHNLINIVGVLKKIKNRIPLLDIYPREIKANLLKTENCTALSFIYIKYPFNLPLGTIILNVLRYIWNWFNQA
jgi:hypothetical protein